MANRYIEDTSHHMYIDCFTDLVGAFSSLVTRAKSKSITAISDPSLVVDFICELPVSKSHESASANLIPKLREAQTLDEVFELIEPFIKFNQYDLLKYLVEKFGEEDMKRELEQYSSSVEKFNRNTTVDQLVELMMKQQNHWTSKERERLRKTEEEGATIKMILDDKYGRNTLDQLQCHVSSIFNCENYVLALAEAKKGSIELLWYTGLGAVHYLTERGKENIKLMDEIGVIKLTVGHNTIKVTFRV